MSEEQAPALGPRVFAPAAPLAPAAEHVPGPRHARDSGHLCQVTRTEGEPRRDSGLGGSAPEWQVPEGGALPVSPKKGKSSGKPAWAEPAFGSRQCPSRTEGLPRKSLCPGQLRKGRQEAVGGTCSECQRVLEGSVGSGRKLSSSPGAREWGEPKALLAEAPGQAESITGWILIHRTGAL